MVPQEERESHGNSTEDKAGKFALQRSVSRKGSGSRRGSGKASKERTSVGGEQKGAKSEEKSNNPHGAGEALKGNAKSQWAGSITRVLAHFRSLRNLGVLSTFCI